MMAAFNFIPDNNYVLGISAFILLIFVLKVTKIHRPLWAMVSAHLQMYISQLADTKIADLKEAKIRLFKDIGSQVTGRPLDILEVGPGDGRNFAFFPAGSKLRIVEPNPNYHPTIRKRIAELGSHLQAEEIVTGVAERLDGIADESVDAYVMTYVMCEVSDVKKTLAQAHRVLRKVRNSGVQARSHGGWHGGSLPP